MRLYGLMRAWLLAAVIGTAGGAFAFQPVPEASARANALGIARGRAFSKGVVFVNGKYLEPPYVVERWGTGIRINGTPVSGQIIDWNDFLKTQRGVRRIRTEEPSSAAVAKPSAPVREPVAEPTPVAASDVDDSASSLDDLFDDAPTPSRVAKPSATARSAAPERRSPTRTQQPSSRMTVSYVLEGDFVLNDAAKAMLARVNAARTEVERILRTGGFICFGDSYSRVSGDKRSLQTVLDSLPRLLEQSTSLDSFRSGVRAAKLVFFNEVLCEDLYRHRSDARRLKERSVRLRQVQKWDSVLEDVGEPLL